MNDQEAPAPFVPIELWEQLRAAHKLQAHPALEAARRLQAHPALEAARRLQAHPALEAARRMQEIMRPVNEAQQEADRLIELFENDTTEFLNSSDISPLVVLFMLGKRGNSEAQARANGIIEAQRKDEIREMLIVTIELYADEYGRYPKWKEFWIYLTKNPPAEFPLSIDKGKRGVREPSVTLAGCEPITKANLKQRFDRLLSPKIDR